MTIHKTQQDGSLTLALEGRLDTTTAPRLQEALLPAFNEASEITLDFANLIYLSSAGLRVLLLGEKQAKASGKIMALTNVTSDVMEVFDMTGFSNILTFIG